MIRGCVKQRNFFHYVENREYHKTNHTSIAVFQSVTSLLLNIVTTSFNCCVPSSNEDMYFSYVRLRWLLTKSVLTVVFTSSWSCAPLSLHQRHGCLNVLIMWIRKMWWPQWRRIRNYGFPCCNACVWSGMIMFKRKFTRFQIESCSSHSYSSYWKVSILTSELTVSPLGKKYKIISPWASQK